MINKRYQRFAQFNHCYFVVHGILCSFRSLVALVLILAMETRPGSDPAPRVLLILAAMQLPPWALLIRGDGPR